MSRSSHWGEVKSLDSAESVGQSWFLSWNLLFLLRGTFANFNDILVIFCVLRASRAYSSPSDKGSEASGKDEPCSEQKILSLGSQVVSLLSYMQGVPGDSLGNC